MLTTFILKLSEDLIALIVAALHVMLHHALTCINT
jgi:hypothetical protein